MAGMMVTYASMPATLSVMPPAVAAAGAPAGAVRPAHTEHIVEPSGTCAPQLLQNAIEMPPGPPVAKQRGATVTSAWRRRRARYQNGESKSIGKRVVGAFKEDQRSVLQHPPALEA